jgi:protein-tyrosine phosphatase
VAASRNIDLSKLAARQITKDDFLTFDYILAMDQSNLDTLARLSPTKSATTPRLLLEFGANCAATEIPDPYYSGIDSYEEVIALIEIGVVGLLKEIQKR